MIDFWLCDLGGVRIKDFTDLSGASRGSVTLTLNGGRSASVPVSFDDPAAALMQPLTTVIKAVWDRGHLFTGVAVRPQYSGRNRTITISARDPSIRMQAFQIGARSDGAGLPSYNNGVYGWVGVDQSEMIARLMEHATPTAAETAAGVPSHGIIRGSLPTSRTRDRVYEPGKQVWEAWTQLVGVVDGVDFDLRPLDQTDGSYVALDTYYPMMGSDRSDNVIFQYGWGSENLVDCDIEPAGDIVKNRSIHVGQLDEVSQTQPTSGVVDRSESVQISGIYSDYVGESDIISAATLTEHALGTVTTYGYPPFFISMVPAQDDGSGYRINASGVLEILPKRYGSPPVLGPSADYWIGDIVSVVVRDGPAFNFDLLARVIEITLSNVPSGAVQAELKLAPVVGGGYRVPGVLPPSFIREFAAMRERQRLAQVVQ